MRRTANILFFISGILCILFDIAYIVAGVVFLILGYNNFYIEGFKDGSTIGVVLFILFLLLATISITTSIICFDCRKKNSKWEFILCGIFGILSVTTLPTVASVLSIISNKVKK